MRQITKVFAILFIALLASCNSTSSDQYSIKGEAIGYEDQTNIFVFKVENNQPKPIDTLFVKDEKFQGTYDLAKVGDIHFLGVDGLPTSLLFFPEKEDLQVKIDKNNPENAHVSGNQVTNSYYKVQNDLKKINERGMEINIQMSQLASENQNHPKLEALKAEFAELQGMRKETFIDYIKNNSNSIFSVNLIASLFQNGELEPLKALELMEHFTPAIANHQSTKELRTSIEAMKDKVVEGSIAPNIVAKTPEGEDLALYEVMSNAKYTLIDFWAGWCAPCRRENPHLVKLYEKYHSQGVEFFGVSLDRTKDEWTSAIEKDRLPWHQVSNLQFWEDPVVQQYGFQGIPYSVVIDNEGKVIATNLRSQQLDKLFNELLN